MDERKTAVLAGMFAVMNIGLPIPKRGKITYASGHRRLSVEDSALIFAGDYIEDGDMERSFVGEAEMWFAELSAMDEAEVARIWPDMVAAYEEACVPCS